jgi:hypothetical protein
MSNLGGNKRPDTKSLEILKVKRKQVEDIGKYII